MIKLDFISASIYVPVPKISTVISIILITQMLVGFKLFFLPLSSRPTIYNSQ